LLRTYKGSILNSCPKVPKLGMMPEDSILEKTTSEEMGEMFEDDSTDMCAGKLPFMSMETE
jgi:hypothetical protein